MRTGRKIVVDGNLFEDDAFEQGVAKAKHVAFGESSALVGFQRERDMAAWAEENGVGERHQDLMKRLRQARRRLKTMTPGEEAALKRQMRRRFAFHKEELADIFAEEGIDPSDVKRIAKLKSDVDVLRGPVVGSAFVYDLPWWSGDWGFFPPGAYPDLGWFGWGDRISASYTFTAALFFTNPFFLGAPHLVVFPVGAADLDLVGLGNRFSSLVG